MFQRVLLDFVLKTFGLGAENETRTRDPNLGKVVLYQLSYFRKNCERSKRFYPFCECKYKAKKYTVQENLKKNFNFYQKIYNIGRFYCIRHKQSALHQPQQSIKNRVAFHK